MTKQELIQLLEPIKIVKVLNVFKHPYADKLNLVVVDLGGKAKVVITGATNMKEGDLVCYLGEGNVVPGYLLREGEKVVLGKKMLRNLESDSMLLSKDEIGNGSDHSGLFIVEPEDKDTLVGESILKILSEGDIDQMLSDLAETSHF